MVILKVFGTDPNLAKYLNPSQNFCTNFATLVWKNI